MKRPTPLLVSIVIPTLNEEHYLARCLGSLQKQTYKHGEIIVSDGGSKDTTVAIARKFHARTIVTPRSSVVIARQKGIEEARGEIIVGADADTFYPPDHIQQIVDDFKKSPDIVAVGGGGIFEPTPRWTYWGWKCTYFCIGKLYQWFNVAIYIPAFNLSFRRATFEQIGGYQTFLDFGGDELDILDRLKKAGTVYFDRKLRVYPSSRRAKVGLFELIVKHTLIDYYLNYALAKLFRRPILRGKPIR